MVLAAVLPGGGALLCCLAARWSEQPFGSREAVAVGLRRQLVSGESSGYQSNATQSRVLLRPDLARSPAGGGTKGSLASSQGWWFDEVGRRRGVGAVWWRSCHWHTGSWPAEERRSGVVEAICRRCLDGGFGLGDGPRQ
uniref:Secreted protein n=1 Tax=Oryza sativa subsp. indica TaxID=39946 RepID=A0A679B9H4_ORYSI|nr:hypothetical protein [Oryza sativa Indica Group]BBD82355.1 hypothetical protein [Oryza sativa Indica Group]